MRAFVFTDASLERQAGRFVWLEIDTEKAQNASVREQFPIRALPSFLVVDPRDESVLLRWVGGATVEQLHTMLDEVAAAFEDGAPDTPADAALARADALYGEGEYLASVEAYREALEAAPSAWAAYSRAVESMLFALLVTDGYPEGARLAAEAFPRLKSTPSAANVAASGLDCALNMPNDDPDRAGLVERLEGAAREVVGNPDLPVAADDRSGVYIALHSARQAAGDEEGARAVAEAWATFLEGEAAKAQTADARAVFDSHRLSAYFELGEPQRALPMLLASELDLPDDYNPPSRLALVYQRLGRWPEALAASDRALTKTYGPRRLTYLRARASIYEDMGDRAMARQTLEKALQEAESLPDGQRSQRTIDALRGKLESLAP